MFNFQNCLISMIHFSKDEKHRFIMPGKYPEVGVRSSVGKKISRIACHLYVVRFTYCFRRIYGAQAVSCRKRSNVLDHVSLLK